MDKKDDVLFKLIDFAESNNGLNAYIQLTKEECIRLADYIDKLEDIQFISYCVIGGSERKYEKESIKRKI